MFTEWGFLLTEIWVLLALAALLGLLAGWIIWGGRTGPGLEVEEVQRLRLALEKERARARASVSGDVGPTDVPRASGVGYVRPNVAPLTEASAAKSASQPKTAVDPEPVSEAAAVPAAPATLEGPSASRPVEEMPVELQSKPEGLEAPKDGIPDDLTKIKGVGKKMEKLCNDLGYYHYEQIAAWTDAEVAWVDDNLADFKGRVTRDNWVAQAKALAVQGAPAFVRRTDTS